MITSLATVNMVTDLVEDPFGRAQRPGPPVEALWSVIQRWILSVGILPLESGGPAERSMRRDPMESIQGPATNLVSLTLKPQLQKMVEEQAMT